LIVHIQILRDNGTILVDVKGNALGKVEWNSQIMSELIDENMHNTLVGFEYFPNVSDCERGY
jgi:hypothetical protein